MKKQFLLAALLALVPFAVHAAVAPLATETRAYEIVVKAPGQDESPLVLTSTLFNVAGVSKRRSVPYTKSCVSETKKYTMGRVSTGYDLEVTPFENNLVIITWAIYNLSQIKKISQAGCEIGLPTTSLTQGRSEFSLEVAGHVEFNEDGYSISIKRTE